MHRRIGHDEIQRVFIRDLALHHLPAIYRALHQFADRQGIALDETPQLQKKQAATKTSDEILQAFPGVLPLPKPLTILDSPKTGTQTEGDRGRLTQAPGRVSQAKADTPAPQVILPAEDLKPLYDSAVQCKECQLQLTIAQANLRDAQAKTAAVSRELADAVRVANGGSPLRGVARAAK
jgi:hypothetical protein